MSNPTILTLDAGGTNFVFNAIKDDLRVADPVRLPSCGDDLDRCLEQIFAGFDEVLASLLEAPKAISFAFPGPADYANGVIGNLNNLPAFRGGVPLGALLEERYKLPVYINNDADLFVAGEAEKGLLHEINTQLEQAGQKKRYKNLIGITLGTGFGVGVSLNGNLLNGDNGLGAEGWLMRNKLLPKANMEETLSIRAVKRVFAEQLSISIDDTPEPDEIYRMIINRDELFAAPALECYLRFGEALGDVIANLVTLFDGIVVIGGGLSGAWEVFSGIMFGELRTAFTLQNGDRLHRLVQKVYNWEDEEQRAAFLQPGIRIITTQNGTEVPYQEVNRIAVGLSKLGTSEAVEIGAYRVGLANL